MKNPKGDRNAHLFPEGYPSPLGHDYSNLVKQSPQKIYLFIDVIKTYVPIEN